MFFGRRFVGNTAPLMCRGMRLQIGRPSIPDKTRLFPLSNKIIMEPPKLNSNVGRIVKTILDQEMSPVNVEVSEQDIKAEYEKRREEIKGRIESDLAQLADRGSFDRSHDDGTAATEEDKKRITELQGEVVASVQSEQLQLIVKDLIQAKISAAKDKLHSSGEKRPVPARLTEIGSGMSVFSEFLIAEPELRRKLINSPSGAAVTNILNFAFKNLPTPITSGAQEVIQDVFSKEDTTVAVSKRNRAAIFEQAAKLFEEAIAYETRQLDCTIASAQALSEDQKKRVVKAVESRVESGVVLKPEFEVNPELLGGICLIMRDGIYDLTAARAIELRLESYNDSNKQIPFC